MQILKTAGLVLLALAMLLFGAMFAADNEAKVPLNLVFVTLEARSVALWVLLAFSYSRMAVS